MKLKLKYITFILLLPFFAFAQNDDNRLICADSYTNDGRLILGNKCFYIYNNSEDTIQLSNIEQIGDFVHCPDFKILKEITLGNSNEKGIVFFRSCVGSTRRHGGTFSIRENGNLTKYEVWSLTTKELVFESINYFQFEFNRFDFSRNEKGEIFYQYDFTIDKKGKIIISNLIRTENIEPDHKEGTYEYIDGKYIKTN
jgi:hypothetical protein